MKSILAALSLISVGITWGSPSLPAAIGDIVHEIGRCGHGWFGGVTWANGYLYESCKSGDGSCAEIHKKHPVTGEVEQTLRVAVPSPTYTTGIAYDSLRQCLWLAVGGEGVYQVNMADGSILSSFDPCRHPYGLYYEPETDLLWVSDNVDGKVRKFRLDGLEQVGSFHLDFLPTGIELIGEFLWVAEPGDYYVQNPAVIYQCTPDGEKTGISFNLPSGDGYYWDAGDLGYDGYYLWAKGGKDTALYQIDITGGGVPSPSPYPSPASSSAPTATPESDQQSALLESTDFNGDGTSDPALFRPSSGLWAVRELSRAYFGSALDIPAPGDYDGDQTAEIAVFQPGTGRWAVRGLTRLGFGFSGDIPLAVDLDGDGRCDPGIFRPGTGWWCVRDLTRFYFGGPGDEPVAGDFQGDGYRECGVFRPASGLWALREYTRLYFGQGGDRPVPDDYFGFDTSIVVVFRPSTGLWASVTGHRIYLGSEGDQPVPADYLGASLALPAVFRSAYGSWSVYHLTRFFFGTEGDRAVTK